MGFFTFGFDVSAISPVANLGLNFLWYLLIATAMYFTPTLHQLFFRGHSISRQEKIQEKINKIDDIQARDELQNYYKLNGRLPPNRRQVLALTILFWILLFELFFINAWVKGEDCHLAWQPFWIEAIWQWMNEHINLPPLNINRDIFDVELKGTIFSGKYTNEEVLLNTPLAKSGFIFNFWRILTFIPVLVCLYVILSQAIDWLGMTKINPANIHSVGSFIWSSIATLIMSVLLFATLFVGLSATTLIYIPTVLGNDYWLNIVVLYIMMIINNIFALKLLWGWGIFWKRILLKFFG